MFKAIQHIVGIDGALAQGSERSNVTTQGRLNGLLVQADSFATVAAASLTVVLRHTNGRSKHLINRVPMLALAGIHDVLRGRAPQSGDTGRVSFYIDLGQLLLAGDDEMQVSIMARSALGAGSSIQVHGVETSLEDAETLITYERWEQDPSVAVPDAVLIAAYAADGETDPMTVPPDVCEFQIRVGERESMRSLRDCAALTRCFGRIESSAPLLAVIYGDPRMQEPEAGVHVRAMGSGTDGWPFLIVRREVIEERADESAAKVAQIKRQAVERAEAVAPVRLDKLRKTMAIPTATVLRVAETRGPALGGVAQGAQSIAAGLGGPRLRIG